VAKKGAICPIFDGDMPPKKYTPKSWPLHDSHNTKAVNRGEMVANADDQVLMLLMLHLPFFINKNHIFSKGHSF
jgi:hypothetical protein